MNRVIEALDGDCSEDDDDEMSKEEGPDDSLTLIQYQEEFHREFLIRKSLHPMDSSQKKERLELGDPGAGPSSSPCFG